LVQGIAQEFFSSTAGAYEKVRRRKKRRGKERKRKEERGKREGERVGGYSLFTYTGFTEMQFQRGHAHPLRRFQHLLYSPEVLVGGQVPALLSLFSPFSFSLLCPPTLSSPSSFSLFSRSVHLFSIFLAIFSFYPSPASLGMRSHVFTLLIWMKRKTPSPLIPTSPY
jgi:hypothetical protein